MPRNDFYYQHVKTALIKAGWKITHDSFPLVAGPLVWSVDLGAERIVAEKGLEKIAVEIKNFRHSESNEIHKTRGQFANYRDVLRTTDADRKLYLAIPEDIYRSLFADPFIQGVIRSERMSIIVFNPSSQTIVEWKD
jgi:hypothetical protein